MQLLLIAARQSKKKYRFFAKEILFNLQAHNDTHTHTHRQIDRQTFFGSNPMNVY